MKSCSDCFLEHNTGWLPLGVGGVGCGLVLAGPEATI